MLDALGDLYLAGAPLLARYEGVRAGHALTNALLRALFARPQAFRMIDCDAACAARLPGSGVTREDLPLVAQQWPDGRADLQVSVRQPDLLRPPAELPVQVHPV